MKILRNFDRTENDDFTLNVQPVLNVSPLKEAVEIRDSAGKLLGWKIQYRYE